MGVADHLSFLLCPRQLAGIFVGFFGQLLNFRAHGIVVEHFALALLDACHNHQQGTHILKILGTAYIR